MKKYILGVSVIILIGLFFYFSKTKKPHQEIFKVTRGDVLSEVSVTGKVKSKENINLAFENNGRIKKIYVKSGDKVRKGDMLTGLKNDDLYAKLQQAQSNLNNQTSKLQQLQKGTRKEQIDLTKTKVDSAKKTLDDAIVNLSNIIKKDNSDLTNLYNQSIDILADSYTKSDDAIRNQVNSLFVNDETDNPTLSFTSINTDKTNKSMLERLQSKDALNKWFIELNIIRTQQNSPFMIDQYLENGLIRLNIFLNFFYDLGVTIEYSSGLSQTTLNDYKNRVAVGRNEIITAIANINNQKRLIISQEVTNKNNIDTAQINVNHDQSQYIENQKQLALEEAGTLPEEIISQQSQVESAKSDIQYYASQIAKTQIIAPFNGIITKVNFDEGEIVNTSQAILSLINPDQFQIEINIPESDIAKVKVNGTANVTLDAYGPNVKFKAIVSQIDSSETIIDGVSTYKTILNFLDQDKTILSGLTANVDILNQQKQNVLYVPTRNIITKNNKQFIKLLKNKNNSTIETIEVKTGLKGSDGKTEILSGLKENDEIIVN